MADETERNPYDQMTNSNMSTLKRGSHIQNKKKLTLNIEDIENISDQDLDSVKNTSAREVTYNQFELTKHVINNQKLNNNKTDRNDDDENDTEQINLDPDQTQNLDINGPKNTRDKFNISQIDLITHQSDHAINSAGSSHRRIQSINHKMNVRNSLNQITDKNLRKSSEFVQNSGLGGLFGPQRSQINSDQKFKSNENKNNNQLTLNQGPYAKLEDDLLNQTTTVQQHESSFSPDKDQVRNENNKNDSSTQHQSQNQLQQDKKDQKQQIAHLLNQKYIKIWIIMVIISALIAQSIQEKLQLELQSAKYFNLSFKKASNQLMSISLFSFILYIPLMIYLSKKTTLFKLIRLLILVQIGSTSGECILFTFLQNQDQNKLMYYNLLNSVQLASATSLMFQLYVLGIKIVPSHLRYMSASVYGLSVTLGYLIGIILTDSFTLIYSYSLYQIPSFSTDIMNIVLQISLLLITFLMKGTSELVFQSTSSSDVLSGSQRLDLIQRENENAEQRVLDQVMNQQYFDKDKNHRPKSKKHKKNKTEQLPTNPQQPSESGFSHQLQEEDETEREAQPPTSSEQRSSKIKEQFNKRIL